MLIRSKMIESFLLVILLTLSAKCIAAPSFLQDVTDSRQIVYTHSVVGTKGVLEAWEQVNGVWVIELEPIEVIVGVNGTVSAAEKREGDGKTPTGLYDLRLAFGYEELSKLKIPYRVVDSDDFWVDDPKSPMYNRLVKGKPDAASYEVMRRQDGKYKFGVVVEYNINPIVPYNGSAIFLHIQNSGDTVTAGCIAMPEKNIRELLLWLDATKKPAIKIE